MTDNSGSSCNIQVNVKCYVSPVNEIRKSDCSLFGYISGITSFSADSSNYQWNDWENNFSHIHHLYNIFTCNFFFKQRYFQRQVFKDV